MRQKGWVIFLILMIGGIFGIHHFVLGNKKMGLLYLCTLGIVGFGIGCEYLFMLFGGYLKDAEGNKYYLWKSIFGK